MNNDKPILSIPEMAALVNLNIRQLSQMARFINEVLAHWPDGGIDGGELQEIAERTGILTPQTINAPCGDYCDCQNYYSPEEMAAGVQCFRVVDWFQHWRVSAARGGNGQD